ncbi:MAG: response regulator [Planctomycetota bacterium]|nr:MAG: response regulator [Planctomycetota bacterium]
MARVMIVEDEGDLSELYRLVLHAGGHTIEGIYADPLSALQASPCTLHPDVIILDERLGMKSGIAHLSEFRSKFPAAKILLASADPEVLDDGPAKGVDSIRKKPFPMNELLDEIRNLSGPASKRLPG